MTAVNPRYSILNQKLNEECARISHQQYLFMFSGSMIPNLNHVSCNPFQPTQWRLDGDEKQGGLGRTSTGQLVLDRFGVVSLDAVEHLLTTIGVLDVFHAVLYGQEIRLAQSVERACD